MLASTSRFALSAARRTAVPAVGSVRNLNVHEYISMELMKAHGIQTPECYVASTPDEAENIFQNSLNKGTSSCCSSVAVGWCWNGWTDS